jgi:hypothetical protein
MIKSNPYHERIQRATARLAHLQARELLATHRQAAKVKQAERREHARRRQRVAELVFVAGAEALDDAELTGALLIHLQSRTDSDVRQDARSIGQAKLDSVIAAA